MKETRIVVELHEVKVWHVRLRFLSFRIERKEACSGKVGLLRKPGNDRKN